MNAKRLLAAFLILVVIILGGIFPVSSAEKLDSLKWSEKSGLEKREGEGGSNRVRRDLATFQQQLKASTYIAITNSTICSPFPCVSDVNKDLCPAFCAINTTVFKSIVDALITCYKGRICNRDLTTVQLPNPVNISVATGNYNGQCYLYGPQVTMTLKNESNSIKALKKTTAYFISEDIYYVFTGLTLFCRPNLPCPTCTGGAKCCPKTLLTEVVCLVQLITGSLGVPLNLLGCDCSCGGSFFGKRQVRAPTDSAPFQVPVTVTQEEMFTIFFYMAYKPNYYDSELQNPGAKTSVTFATPLPTPDANDITNGIQTVFQAYDTFYYLQYNFKYAIGRMLGKTFFITCPLCP